MRLKNLDKLVLGTAGIGGVWRKVDPQESVLTILAALEQGIMAIDTAPAYGHAEQFIGEALNQWSGDRPLISTKVGRMKGFKVDEAQYNYTADGMKRSVENSLKTLNVPILEVLFLHDPAAVSPSDMEAVIRQMDDFKQLGYAKKIGLGGNAPEWFEPYLRSHQFDVIMEYNRLNACCIDALDTTISMCATQDKTYYAASPLNMGLLGCNFSEFTNHPPDWLDFSSITQAKKIKTIADKYNVSLEMVAHRFLLSIPAQFKIVIGAADREELTNTITAINSGGLPPIVYNEIRLTLNQS